MSREAQTDGRKSNKASIRAGNGGKGKDGLTEFKRPNGREKVSVPRH